MMRSIFLFLFVWTFTACWAGQSLIATSTPGKLSLPSNGAAVNSPYDSIGNTRVEMRLTGLQACGSSSSKGIFTLTATNNYTLLSLACTGTTTLSLNTYIGNYVTVASDTQLAGNTDIIVRVQRDTILQRYTYEVWATDGVKLAEYITPGITSFSHGNLALRPAQTAFLGGNGVVQYAWLRWYSDIVPVGSAMPMDRGAARGDLGNWEFEGNLQGVGRDGSELNIERPNTGCPDGRCFVDSPTYKPVVQIATSNTVAGGEMILDGSQSFTYGDSELSEFVWEAVSSPAPPIISDRNAAKTSVTGLVTGSYVFKLTVKDSVFGEFSKEAEVKVVNTDSRGAPIFPLAAHQLTGTIPIPFNLEDAPGAVDVRVTVRKPDGRTLKPVVCTESPCNVTVDNRQRDHAYRLEYRNAAGEVILTSDWKPLPVGQTNQSTYSRSGYNKFGAYLAYNTPPAIGNALSAASGKFFSSRLYVGVNGRNPREWNPDMPMSLRYIDAVGVYPNEMTRVWESAERRGFYVEDIFGHYDVNHSYKIGTSQVGWVAMDRFDAFSKDASGNYVDGIYTSDGGTFSDRSNAAAANLTPAFNKLYIGYSEPFDEINLQVSNSPSGCSTVWEYWDGGKWTAITPRTDTTMGLAASGRLLFTPPANWSKFAMTAARSQARPKWWLRASVTGCSTYPAITQIAGDNLTTGSTNQFGNPIYRGWCSSSPTRINSGLPGDARSLEYDPTPPQNCSARFRWQARMLALWAANLAVCNIANVQNGEYTCARYLVDESLKYLSSQNWNGIFLDDLYEPNTRDIAEPSISGAGSCPSRACVSDLVARTEIGGGDYIQRLATHYEKVGEYVREQDPSFKIGANTGYWETASRGNMALIELGHNPWSASFDPTANGSRVAAWDQFKPENNPGSTLGLFAMTDTSSELEINGSWIAWDRGNRGPITSYAQCLFYANENTACFYTTSSPFFYAGRDDFYYWKETPEFTTTAPVVSNKGSNTVKYIEGDFTALNHPRFAPVDITSIEGNTVQLRSPIAGLSSGQYVLIDGTSNPDHNVMVRVGAVNGSTFTSPDLRGSSTGGSATRQPPAENMRIGDRGEYLPVWKVDDHKVATIDKIWNDYDTQTGIYRIHTGHLSTNPLPPLERIAQWGYWTPAFDIDPGVPDTENGIVGDDGQRGNRKTAWITRQDSGLKNGVNARSFTRCLVLWASGWNTPNDNFTTYSEEIDLRDTYYPLRADGTTGPGITSIRIRGGEAAILMREPVE